MKKIKNTTFPFRVADVWPDARAPASLRADAVQALVANHTLIVGQSRSGKTNAARRLIEEILTWTKTQVVILDPNADFKLLSHLGRDQSDLDFVKRWELVGRTIGIVARDGAAWGIPWNKLSLAEMAAFLRLTPKESFAEYRHLDRHYKYEKTKSTLQNFANSHYFQVAVGEELERYRLLLHELAARKVWATPDGKKDLDSLLAEDHRAIVVDLSINDEEVRTITAARTLEVLWRRGEANRNRFLRKRGSWAGTLVVIDEAHIFAPPFTDDPQKRAVCERIERFADQGKKLNLYLMVITQQPTKLHKGVLAECSNRIILKVNERLSLEALENTYGGIRGRYDGALTFNPGEALIEGALLCDEIPPPAMPRGARFLKARTKEGGGTPEADWARPALI
jgi:uncharacterized protein